MTNYIAGDTLDEAIANAAEILDEWAIMMAEDGKAMPAPRTLEALKSNPEVAADIAEYMVAVIPLHKTMVRDAAE